MNYKFKNKLERESSMELKEEFASILSSIEDIIYKCEFYYNMTFVLNEMKIEPVIDMEFIIDESIFFKYLRYLENFSYFIREGYIEYPGQFLNMEKNLNSIFKTDFSSNIKIYVEFDGRIFK